MLEKENSCTNRAPVNTGVYRRNYFSRAAISPQPLCVARHTCSAFPRRGRKEQGGSGRSGSIPTSREVSDQPWAGRASEQLRWQNFLFLRHPLPPPLSVLEQGPACSPLPARPTQLLCQPQGSGSKRPISGGRGGEPATLQA